MSNIIPLTKEQREKLHAICNDLVIPIDKHDDSKTAFRLAAVYEKAINDNNPIEKDVYEKYDLNYAQFKRLINGSLLNYNNKLGPVYYYMLNHDLIKEEGITNLYDAIEYIRSVRHTDFRDESKVLKHSLPYTYKAIISKTDEEIAEMIENNIARKNLNGLYADENYRLNVIELNDASKSIKEVKESTINTPEEYNHKQAGYAILYLKNMHKVQSAFDDLKLSVTDIRSLDKMAAYRIKNNITCSTMSKIIGKSESVYYRFEKTGMDKIKRTINILSDLYKKDLLKEYIPVTPSIIALFGDHPEIYDSADITEEEFHDPTPEEFKERLGIYNNIKENLSKGDKDMKNDITIEEAKALADDIEGKEQSQEQTLPNFSSQPQSQHIIHNQEQYTPFDELSPRSQFNPGGYKMMPPGPATSYIDPKSKFVIPGQMPYNPSMQIDYTKYYPKGIVESNNIFDVNMNKRYDIVSGLINDFKESVEKIQTRAAMQFPKRLVLNILDDVEEGEYNRIVKTIRFMQRYYEILISSDSESIVRAVSNLDSKYLK